MLISEISKDLKSAVVRAISVFMNCDKSRLFAKVTANLEELVSSQYVSKRHFSAKKFPIENGLYTFVSDAGENLYPS